jgi:MFS transporter, ACS family, hexuronate transporter
MTRLGPSSGTDPSKLATSTETPQRPIRYLRWWIGGLLFLSTVINYIDRQTLAVLAPYLKQDYRWTNADLALIFIAFRIAYAGGQLSLGHFIDRLGTRLALSLAVAWYSLVAMLTSVGSLLGSARAILRSFVVFRFLLGLGESANWPTATKAVSEWFPKEERAWAVALFDGGSSIGAAVAPALVVGLYLGLGRRWWPPFVFVGTLGFIWLSLWRRFYHSPEKHPRIEAAELQMILDDRRESAEAEAEAPGQPAIRWIDLMKTRQMWGIFALRAFSNPVWFFITDWFMLFLVQEKHFEPRNTLIAIWIPFVAYDAGDFLSGALSGWLIRRGWRVERTRKVLLSAGALGMAALIPAIYATNLFAIAGCFGFATLAYGGVCTMGLVLPCDIFQSKFVGSVGCIANAGGGLITIVATYLIGDITTRYSFKPILVAGSVIPLIGAALACWLIQNPRTEHERRMMRQF